MTENKTRRQILLLFCSLCALFLGLRYSELCAEGVRYGIELSVNKLIPSLFPFMVISDVIVNTGACSLLARVLSRPFSRLFGISGEGALPFLLGMLFGFPIGIKAAIELYEDGRIDRRELIRLSLFTSLPSPAFFISAVGEGLFGSLSFGVILYAIAVLTSIIIGVATRQTFERERGEYFCGRGRGERSLQGGNAFILAVTSSARSLLSISAFVVFFSMVSQVLEHFAKLISLDTRISLCLLGALEMTGGVARAAYLGESGAPLAAAMLGFSGISVLCQFIYICKSHALPLAPYVISKLFSAALYFLLSLGAIRFLDGLISFDTPSLPSFVLYGENRLTLVLFALFVCACFMAASESKTKIFQKTIYKS